MRDLSLFRLPHNRDSVPNVLSFFINSQFITLFLLVQTIFAKMFITSQHKPSKWIEDVVAYANKIKEINPTKLHSESEGSLIDEQTNLSPDEIIRESFTILIDRCLLIGLAATYFYMFRSLIPDATNKNTPSLIYESLY